VLARNLIPVVGIYGFGWSAALAVFNYWFDGLYRAGCNRRRGDCALAARGAAEIGAAAWVKNLVGGPVTWVFLVGIIGLPYWIVLIPLHGLLLGNELRRELAHSPALWFTFGSLAPDISGRRFRSGYDAMPRTS